MTRQAISVSDFNLKHTFESAQPLAFFADYDRSSNSVSYAEGDALISVSSSENRSRAHIAVKGTAKNPIQGVITRFRLRDDMFRIYKKIGMDDFTAASIGEYRGMRLTVNDPWETTVMFIISQLNNVKRIRSITRNIIGRFGKEIKDEDGNIVGRGFPERENLAHASIKELMECGAGFRAKYIISASRFCMDNLDLGTLGKRYGRTKSALMEIDGVGDKVADCIALMGYGHLEAFPIDTWIKKTMERVYFDGESMKTWQIHDFAEDMWGKLRGYAQQYIYWYGRNMV